jgi:hypothetical protein
MGVSLSYETIGPASDTAADAMLRSADEIAGERDWWCESIMLWRDEGRLAGDTKLYLLTGDPDEDEFMAMFDARFITRTLARWSVEYGVDWELMLAGETIGTIRDGEDDEPLEEFFHEVTADWPDSEDEVEARARRILAEHR